MGVIHLRRGDNLSACGITVSLVTIEAGAVTCKSCLKQIEIANRPPAPIAKASEIPPEPRSFFTTVAGVTHKTIEGADRQKIIERCVPGDELTLFREPGNRHDRGAIAILRSNGEHLGYIPAHVSRRGDPTGMAEQMDAGVDYRCRIAEITGGRGGKSYGVNIEVTDGAFPDSATAVADPARQSPPKNSGSGSTWLWLVVLLLGLAILALLVAKS
jgi:hypothetical protein